MAVGRVGAAFLSLPDPSPTQAGEGSKIIFQSTSTYSESGI